MMRNVVGTVLVEEDMVRYKMLYTGLYLRYDVNDHDINQRKIHLALNMETDM